jgi:predicted MFS family arabinose efflux permease
MAMGPLVGGFFAQTVSWRWIFLVNPPVVVAIGVAVIAAWVAPAAERAPQRSCGQKFDLRGLLALLFGLSATTIGLMQGNEWGWSDPITLLVLAGGAIGIAAFVVLETRQRQPLIELTLFRIPAFAGGVLIFFVFQFDKIVVFVFVPMFLQRQLDFSPIEAGLPLVFATLPTILTSLLAGRSTDRFGARLPTAVGLLSRFVQARQRMDDEIAGNQYGPSTASVG